MREMNSPASLAEGIKEVRSPGRTIRRRAEDSASSRTKLFIDDGYMSFVLHPSSPIAAVAERTIPPLTPSLLFSTCRDKRGEAREVCHNAVCVSDCLTCVDSPSVAGGEPFARGFRLVGARLEEDAYLGAFWKVEVAGCVAFEGGADTLGESLLRLHYDVAVALNGCLIVGLRRALFLF